MNNSGGAAQNAMQTSLQNQGQAAQGIQAGATSLTNTASQLNAPLPATMQGISSAIASGGNLSGQTGVNQNKIGQQVTKYETNPGATNLSQANSGLQSFYQGEMKNGLNPQTQNNAQNQLQQQNSLNKANINNSATPGRNLNNQKQQMDNAELGMSANLAGNLAGQNQSIMQSGAAGVASTAGGLDTQTMQMLQNALSGSQGINSSQLQNLMSVLGLGTSAAGQGITATGAANSANDALFSGYGSQAQNFGQQAASAPSPLQQLGSLAGSVAGFF